MHSRHGAACRRPRSGGTPKILAVPVFVKRRCASTRRGLQATEMRRPSESIGGARSKPVRKALDVTAGQADVAKFTVGHPGKTSPGLSLQAPSPGPPCGTFCKADKNVYCSGARGNGTILMHDCHCLDLLPVWPSSRFGRLVCPGVVTLALREQIHCLHTRLAGFAWCASARWQVPFSMQPV